MSSEAPGAIRLATGDDLGRIHEIAVAGWTPIFTRYRYIVGERMWNDVWGGWEKKWFLHTADQWHGRGVVTEIDGEVVGFATWAFPSKTLAEVGGNAVDPRFQGRGIGAAQIRWVIERFRRDAYKCAKVHTGMDPAHGPARAEYRKAGLRRCVANSVYLNYLDEVARIPVRGALSFRWAESTDAEAVRLITRESWRPVYEGVRGRLGDGLFEWAFPNVLERRADEFEAIARFGPEKVRIVEEDGRPVGFSIIEEEPEKRLGIIRTVAVAPEAQGRAVAAGLCMDAFDVLRGRGFPQVRLIAGLGEVTEQTRQMCWNVGLYRELPSIDYYMQL